MDELTRFKQLRQFDLAENPTVNSNVGENIQRLASMRNQGLTAALETINNARSRQNNDYGEYITSTSGDNSAYMGETGQNQSTMLPNMPRITQQFGQKSKYDVFSNGVNYGVDFAVKENTPLALPPGQWQVVEAYSGANNRGRIGDKTNRGYGNSVLVVNTQTGEKLRYSHLKGVGVQPGKVYSGGTVIGASGATGNVTGPHLDLEYKNAQGRLADVLNSPYARYLFGS